jgi:colicin import membrane protein
MSSKKTNEEKAGEIGSVAGRVKAAGAVSQKERDARDAKNAGVLATVAQTTVEKAVTAVTTAGLSVQKSLAEVSAELQAKLVELSQVADAITIKKAELVELHDKEIVGAALDQLLVKYETQKADLNKNIAEARTLWDQEQRLHMQAIAERDAIDEKAHQRAEDAYSYTTAQRHKAVEDAWNEEQRRKHIAEEERATQLTKSWNDRELALKARETELADLKVKVDGFPVELKKAEDRTAAIVGNTMKKDHQHELELLKRDSASEKALLAAQVATATAAATAAATQITDLQAKLAEANNKITEIATKALDAASGRQALMEVTNMQRNEANGPAKGGRS